VRELRGIGSSIERRLRELVETGQLAELAELRESVRPDLLGLAQTLGVRSSRLLEIADRLGVHSAAEFHAAAEAGRLLSVPGIGAKTDAKLRAALAAEPTSVILTLPAARSMCERVASRLGGVVAGDVRRWRDECRSLAVVCSSHDPADTIARFESVPDVLALVSTTERSAVGLTAEGATIELVVSPPSSFGTALLIATGSEAYVAALGELPDKPTEDGIYSILGLPFCPPELREAPFLDTPPCLLELADIRGDLHLHTTWSDGKASVLEMAEAARDRGYRYIAICDHTPSVGAVPGLDPDGLRRQADEIAEANEQLAPFKILRGVECDIRRDGSLDLPDHILAELDWVQLSLHAGQRTPGPELTARVTEAMRHPAVRCLSHPRGRIINRRPPNALDLERVISVALECDVALEVNGLPDRLDLTGEDIRLAVEANATLVVSTDAHSVQGLKHMELAVATARRGFATRSHVLNTKPRPPAKKRP
jgi:DNA polymerase (family 10)